MVGDVMEFMRSFDLSKEGVQIWNKWRKRFRGDWLIQIYLEKAIKCVCMYVCVFVCTFI